MQDQLTVPAVAESTKGSGFVPGTLGLDIYLATLSASRDALRAPRLPQVSL